MVIKKQDYIKLLKDYPQQAKKIKMKSQFRHKYNQKLKQQAQMDQVQKPIFQKILKRQQTKGEKMISQDSVSLNKIWKLKEGQNVENYLIEISKEQDIQAQPRSVTQKVIKKHKNKNSGHFNEQEQPLIKFMSQGSSPQVMTTSKSKTRIIISNQEQKIKDNFTVSNGPDFVIEDQEQNLEEEKVDIVKSNIDQITIRRNEQANNIEKENQEVNKLDQDEEDQDKNDEELIRQFMQEQQLVDEAQKSQRSLQQSLKSQKSSPKKLQQSVIQILKVIKLSTAKISSALEDIKEEEQSIDAYLQSNNKKLDIIKNEQNSILMELKQKLLG